MEEKLTYAVIIIRKDGNHIIALESEDYDACHDRWKSLVEQWHKKGGIENPGPFVIEDPIVTAFEPGLISSITIKPLEKDVKRTKRHHNPFENKMQQEGLSSMFSGHPGADQLLDGGFKY